MPATTPIVKMPYPLGSDPVADGDNQIRALADRIEARLPHGIIARVAITVQPPGMTAQGDVPGLTITAPLVAGRWYRMSCRGVVTATVAAGRAQVHLFVDGAQGADWIEEIAQNQYMGFNVEHEFQATTASHTVKVQASSNTALIVFSCAANRPMTLVLEDVGPVVTT